MRQSQRHLQGFTLIELMIAISVAAILIGVGIPGMRNMILDNRRAAVVNEIVTGISQARAAAFARNLPVVMCVADDAANPGGCDATGNWADGWFVFVDADGNNAFDAGEEILKVTGPASQGIDITSFITARRFTRNTLGNNDTITVCANNSSRGIVIDQIGHTRLNSGTC
jgi:type IV fimbrial biogenesis protein FimT